MLYYFEIYSTKISLWHLNSDWLVFRTWAECIQILFESTKLMDFHAIPDRVCFPMNPCKLRLASPGLAIKLKLKHSLFLVQFQTLSNSTCKLVPKVKKHVVIESQQWPHFLVIFSSSSYYSCCSDRIPDKNNLRKEWIVLAHVLLGQAVHHGAESW